VQLRDAAGQRVLSTARIVATATALNPSVSFTSTGVQVTSLQGGTYQIWLDPASTKLVGVTGAVSAAPVTRSVTSRQPTAVSVDLAVQTP
jgi:hypothetical protein